MTNKEAIKSLKKLKSFHNGSYGSAIDRAIEALEQMDIIDKIIDPRDFIESEEEE